MTLFLAGLAVGLLFSAALRSTRHWWAFLAYKRGDFRMFGMRHGMKGAELERFVKQCERWQN